MQEFVDKEATKHAGKHLRSVPVSIYNNDQQVWIGLCDIILPSSVVADESKVTTLYKTKYSPNMFNYRGWGGGGWGGLSV